MLFLDGSHLPLPLGSPASSLFRHSALTGDLPRIEVPVCSEWAVGPGWIRTQNPLIQSILQVPLVLEASASFLGEAGAGDTSFHFFRWFFF